MLVPRQETKQVIQGRYAGKIGRYATRLTHTRSFAGFALQGIQQCIRSPEHPWTKVKRLHHAGCSAEQLLHEGINW